MTRYSVQPRDRKVICKRSFPENVAKNIGKNISKNLSSKYREKLIDRDKQFATDALKAASKRVIQKTAKATGDLIGN